MDTKVIAELDRDELYAYGAELRQGLTEIPTENRSPEDNAQMRALIDEVNLLDATLTTVELQYRKEQADLVSTRGGYRDGADQVRSLGEVIVNEEMTKWVEGRAASWEMGMSNVGSLDQMFAASLGLETRAVNEWSSSGPGANSISYDPSGAGNLLPVGQPIAPIPRQARLYLRDLIPTMTTTLAAIPYVQELNPTSYESASAVAEGGVKPNATLSFQGAKADPTVIAATLVISKQLFEDAQAVVQYINTRLPYLVKFKEDNEFLNGSGTWPDITGILNTSGVQSQSVNVDNATTLGTAFADVELHDGTPTAVVLNPTNAWKMFTQRAAGGSGTFDAGTPFSALPLTIWGVPTYRTRAMPVNSALVGDFQLGAMIADREEVNVATYRERYAEQNQILLVCEERVGLMVFRPDLFVNTTLN